jgi:RNA polymerase sigma-70 factor, ECF subfamily
MWTMDVKAGRRVELERLYREEGNRLWWALLAYSGDRDIASDAVSEAFAQALRRGEALTSPMAWIWKAAFRVAAGELQRRNRLAPLSDEGTYEMAPAGALLAALKKLSPRQRGVIVLHDYAGYRLTEVAEILGTAGPTARVHLHRARKRLRELLEDRDE